MDLSHRTLAATCMMAAALLAGCSDGEAMDDQPEVADEQPAEDAAADRDPSELDDDLPPADPLALEALYGDELAELGVHLTDRGGLIDRTGGYESSSEGTHLALYVAPIGDRTDDEYVDGIVELARLFLPDVFDRWPGLETFDVCQELPEDEETGYVSTVTQIDIGRSAAADLDWDTVELADLVRASEVDETFALRVMGDLQMHPKVIEAQRTAGNGGRDGWGS